MATAAMRLRSGLTGALPKLCRSLAEASPKLIFDAFSLFLDIFFYFSLKFWTAACMTTSCSGLHSVPCSTIHRLPSARRTKATTSYFFLQRGSAFTLATPRLHLIIVTKRAGTSSETRSHNKEVFKTMSDLHGDVEYKLIPSNINDLCTHGLEKNEGSCQPVSA